jgi:hypothetical protein
MGRGMRGGALLALLAVAGCGGGGGGSQPPQDADKGNAAATKAVRVEAVRAWLDPDQIKKYDNTVAVVVRNTSDKLATGVTVVARWPNGYNTSQQNAIAIPPGQQGIFLLGPFKPDPPVTGDPKAEVRVDQLKPAPKQEAVVKFSGIKESGKCAATGTVSNAFKHNHPGTSGLIAGLKNGKIVTAGSIFFQEPGLLPGKTGSFKADLAPLCPSGTPDEWVAYAQLGERELAKP